MINLARGHFTSLLSMMPEGWRLVHIGENARKGWRCEIARPDGEKDGYLCAVSPDQSSAYDAFADAIARAIRQQTEWHKYEPNLYRLTTIRPLELQEL